MTKTAYCNRPGCHVGRDVPQPISEFMNGKRRVKRCQTCRDYLNNRARVRREKAPVPAPNGYGPAPRRAFTLAPHHYVLDVNPWHRFGHVTEKMKPGGSIFPLLRDPKGRPVARQHADLKPGEVSLVLR